LNGDQFHFRRTDGLVPTCCATCLHAIVRGGQRGGALRRWCSLRETFLPQHSRARLRYNTCDGHELAEDSPEALDIYERLIPDDNRWVYERDFAKRAS